MPIINPQRTSHEPEIAGPGLLLINPDEMRAVAALLAKRQGRRYPLFNGELWQLADSEAWIAGPAVGAPMAVMTVEKLIAMGCQKLYVYGWCGALHPSLRCGDLLLARWGSSEEGTSAHYPLPYSADSSPELRNNLHIFLQDKGYNTREGKVWTTDAPYRELRTKVQSYAQQGIVAVDMEFSALATVAAFRAIDMAALFLVSDELYHQTWRPGFTSKEFRRKSRNVVDLLLSLISQHPS